MTGFDAERAKTYDQTARTTLPGYEALHEMARHALAACLGDRPARVLLLGVGTGYEAEQLRRYFPQWRLTGVDPAEPMLSQARFRLGPDADLRHGVLDDFPDLDPLDGVLSIGVLHHLSSRAEQSGLVASVGRRLRPGGPLVLGAQVGPYPLDSLRLRALQARWQEQGHPVEEKTQLFRTHTLPPDPALLAEWYRAAGLTPPEVVYSTGFFQLVAAVKG